MQDVARERIAGGVKRWLEEISVEMGLDGEITEAVMKEGEKRMKKIRVKPDRKKKSSQSMSRIAQELLVVARELIGRKQKAIRVDWEDWRSVKEAEMTQKRLENQGYRLVQTVGGFTTSELIYELD